MFDLPNILIKKFDLPYILTHPLTAAMFRHCAELRGQANTLPDGSAERKSIEKRISQLEEYTLPRPNVSEQQVTQIVDRWGQVVGETSSLRRRFKNKRRGRPEEYAIQSRAALEEKLSEPQMTWPQLAEKHKFESAEVLKRSVRRLKALLRREAIPLPTSVQYQEARQEFEDGWRNFSRKRRGEE